MFVAKLAIYIYLVGATAVASVLLSRTSSKQALLVVFTEYFDPFVLKVLCARSGPCRGKCDEGPIAIKWGCHLQVPHENYIRWSVLGGEVNRHRLENIVASGLLRDYSDSIAACFGGAQSTRRRSTFHTRGLGTRTAPETVLCGSIRTLYPTARSRNDQQQSTAGIGF